MPQQSFDDAALRTAMQSYLAAARGLDDASAIGGEARQLLDVAEAKAMAAMNLHKRLVELGWTAPATQRTTT